MADKEDEGKKDGRLLRALKLVAKIDWKSMAMVLGVLGGCAGAVWNQVDSWVQQAHDERTQSGTYELLAQRLDELYERVEMCELAHEPAEEPPEPARPIDESSRTRGKPKPKPVEVVSADRLPASSPLDEPTMIEMTMESAAPPELVAYESSRLPSFEVIQQMAEQLEDMESFMEDMKAR